MLDRHSERRLPWWRRLLNALDPVDTANLRIAAERDRYWDALHQIREIAAREWAADETNYEWYGDIAGIAEEALK